MTCQVCGNTLEAWLCFDCSEYLLSAATRLLEKLEKKNDEILGLEAEIDNLRDQIGHWAEMLSRDRTKEYTIILAMKEEAKRCRLLS